MENRLSIEELEEHSTHIDDIYKKIGEKRMALTLNENIEIQKFYIYAKMLLSNIENVNNILVDLYMLTRKEVIMILKLMQSNRIVNKRIVNLLNSRDIESVKLGINLIKIM